MNNRLDEFIHSIKPCRTPKEIRNLPFGEIAWSWIVFARKQLKEEAKGKLSRLSARALLDLEKALAKRWIYLCTSSFHFVLEYERFNLTLRGNSSKKRYQNFVQENFFHSASLRRFFQEYAELTSQIFIYLDFWIEHTIEFLERLENDLPCLQTTFNVSLKKIVSLSMNAGDAHNRGRSVIILTFDYGFNLVYKPKNLNIVHKFHQLLEWLQTQPLSLDLIGYQVLPRGDYGWEEKVEQKPCTDVLQVKNYFVRCGMYLALMYWLNGIDLHHENVIADGEHPRFIDLETLFSTHVATTAKEDAEDFIQHSVLFTGLLPGMIMRKGVEKGVDLSGLSKEHQGTRSVPRWKNSGTDKLHFGLVEIELSKRLNQVVLDGKIHSAKEFIEEIVSGFNEMYTLIEQNKKPFEIRLALLEKEPIRIVLRSTRIYADLINDVFDPHCALNQNLFQEKLNSLHTNRKNQYPALIVEEEKRSILQGDIPCFHAFPLSKDLYSNNVLIAKDCLEDYPIQHSRSNLYKMNEMGRKIQETFIRQSFSVQSLSVHNPSNEEKIGTSLPSEEQILQTAIKIAEELHERAFISKNDSLGWIGLEPNLSADEHRLTPLGESLFSGRTGISLFFAALANISKDKKWEHAALNSISALRESIQLDRDLTGIMGIGGMTGVGGCIYGLLNIGKLLNKPELIEEAKKVIDSILPVHIDADEQYDVIFGSAGLILSLLSFHKQVPSPDVLNLAMYCGKHLCKKAKNITSKQAAWQNEQKKSLLGMSHGNAGIAYALAKLNQAEFHPTIQRAFTYERSYYSKEEKNWPHLGINAFRCAWCHGGSGIGLARLFSAPYIQDQQIDQEISDAIEITIQHLNEGGATLCCSLPGRLEFLSEAAKTRKELLPFVERGIKNLFAQLDNPPEEIYRPNFMQGQAGLGYTLLRLLDKNLPQVLVLD